MMPREALWIVLRPEHLRRTVTIALVVGTILTLINQLDVFIKGDATTLTWLKCVLNYGVPFIVSNLGLPKSAPRRSAIGRLDVAVPRN